MTVILTNIAIAGYRSFGAQPQYFDRFAKINIFIGKNNSGKSNVLRLLKEVLPFASERHTLKLEPLAAHLPDQPPLRVGVGEPFEVDETGRPAIPKGSDRTKLLPADGRRQSLELIVAEALMCKAKVDGTELCWSMNSFPETAPSHDSWPSALAQMSDQSLQRLWMLLTNSGQGDRKAHWEPQTIERFPLRVPQFPVEFIPAIRRIGEKGTEALGFDGTGLIDRLAQLQNPDAHRQSERQKFEAVNAFLQDVTDRVDARIEIPYARDTILIHMDNRVLPIESLGSGLHEVLILAAAATTLTNRIVCVEEPELHLNPVLQKKLVRYLQSKTENQYFITSHSAALMDTPGAEIYHITLGKTGSTAERVTTDRAKSAVCEDLGYHPSDLLQANCILWVEGPSDRLYINWWLSTIAAELTEGIHYSIMFYGGKLAAHVSNADAPALLEDFIMLRRLNRRGTILIDSDKSSAHAHLNNTKKRLRIEFDTGPGHAWITDGREVENYIPEEQLSAAIATVMPSAIKTGGFGRFDNTLKVRRASGSDDQASKVEVARYIASNFKPNFDVLDLRKEVIRLRDFIYESNPRHVNGAL